MAVFELDQEPLEQAAQRACEIFVEIYRGLEGRRVDPGVDREELRRLFRGSLRDEGRGLLEALEEFREQIMPRSMATAHPLYLGLVNSSPFPAAALADLLISSLNNNCGAFHQSPAITTLEEEVVESFAQQLGLGSQTSGMVLPGGSFATLQGLAMARERHFPEWSSDGPRAVTGQPILYASAATHLSVAKDARMLGLGDSGVRAVPTLGRGAMDPQALADCIRRDRQSGGIPFAVAATIGTTGTGAVDPVAEIAELCRQHDLWLHVDACYGGAAALLDELRALFAGIQRADSVAIDPHKWFFVPITAALFFHRHGELDERTFSVPGTCYIPSGGETDAISRGIPTSRRSSALAVWMGLRAHGWDAVRVAVRRNIALTRLLEEHLGQSGFAILPDGQLSIGCARWEPEGWGEPSVDRLQVRIAEETVATGVAWFATVEHAGKKWLRFNMVNLHTREHHIHSLVGTLLTTARQLEGSGPGA
jgi:aromatic-L-amino-acid decarboxylase